MNQWGQSHPQRYLGTWGLYGQDHTALDVLALMAKLRQEGRITRVGSDKTGHWVVAE